MDSETPINRTVSRRTVLKAAATRRQNVLVPPRRHRAFPLLELIRQGG